MEAAPEREVVARADADFAVMARHTDLQIQPGSKQ
jgi:hypothetical protein